jgi:hypothetical protein
LSFRVNFSGLMKIVQEDFLKRDRVLK